MLAGTKELMLCLEVDGKKISISGGDGTGALGSNAVGDAGDDEENDDQQFLRKLTRSISMGGVKLKADV